MVGVAAIVVFGVLIRRRTKTTQRLPAGERYQPAVVQNALFEPPQHGLALDAADHSEDAATIAALSQHGQSAEYAAPSVRQAELYEAGQVSGAADHSRKPGYAPPMSPQQPGAEYATVDGIDDQIPDADPDSREPANYAGLDGHSTYASSV